MASGAVIVELLGDEGNVLDFTVSTSASIEKGDLCTLKDNRTISGGFATGEVFAGDYFAGVASVAKTTDTVKINLGMIRNAVIDVIASGAILFGEDVILDLAPNHVKQADASVDSISGASKVGYALETATNGEVIEVRMNI